MHIGFVVFTTKGNIMKKDDKLLAALEASPLFMGINEDDICAMMDCLAGSRHSYKKNEYIFHLGDTTDAIGLILLGSVSVMKEDYWGNRNIVAKMERGDIFAESYACVPGSTLGVSVQASEDCEVVFFKVQKMMTTCDKACDFHVRLSQNLLSTLAAKNLFLNSKLNHMVQRTRREKLLSYLSEESMKHGRASFDIPFNRQQLADFLSVDRSAMSNELCKMRDEGILTFNKNHFMLKDGTER